ncbi:MAG TPA: inorganic diphosphatase [Symbiobacteriaceae bacterium]|jgi:inorganic pyrophosphatase|nr:inorganic diphosphatase [Symbiobacteriaceae bacterium]
MPNIIDVIVEIPKGSQNKYVWDQARGRVRLDRVLHSSIHYPADYGFIPGTMAPDGRPVDVLMLVTNATFPGCLMRGKVIGCLKTTDEKGEDIKIIAVPVHDPRLQQTESLHEVQPHVLKEIEYFFAAYKALEGKPVEVEGWGGIDEAMDIVHRCTLGAE